MLLAARTAAAHCGSIDLQDWVSSAAPAFHTRSATPAAAAAAKDAAAVASDVLLHLLQCLPRVTCWSGQFVVWPMS
jgi:hypothetical protein